MGCGQVYTANEDIWGCSIAEPSGDLYPRSGYSPKDDMILIANAPTDMAALLGAVRAVLGVHEPVDAIMYGGKNAHKVQVCTGCGQDDGNWNRYPCPTVTAINAALEGKP
jgi:hypothetical protein